MKILIVGCGGIGGFLGARLAHAGCEVHIVARGETLAALRKSGLSLRSPLGNLAISQVRASDDASTLSEADVVFNCVKLWDNESAIGLIRKVVNPQTQVLSWQNGVRSLDLMTKSFGPSRTIGATCYISARVDNPSCIVHSGLLQRFIIGESEGKESSRLDRIRKALIGAGVEAEISTEIETQIWKKFIFLVALSGATTSMRSSIGPIREDPRSRSFLRGLLHETTAVARAKGVALDADFADSQLALIDNLPAEMTSSMYADLTKGKRLELPWLSEDVAILGSELKVATPLNAAVRDLLSLHSRGVYPRNS